MRHVQVGPILDDSGTREIRVCNAVAYGTVEVADGTYCIVHAPTQADFDAVSTAIAEACTYTEGEGTNA